MRDTRVLPTIVIWLAVAGMMSFLVGILAVTDAEVEWWGALMLLFLFISGIEAATKSTKAIWKADSIQGTAAKAKRVQQNRITRLVDSLDDDDIYELEALLLAREHEGSYHNGRH